MHRALFFSRVIFLRTLNKIFFRKSNHAFIYDRLHAVGIVHSMTEASIPTFQYRKKMHKPLLSFFTRRTPLMKSTFTLFLSFATLFSFAQPSFTTVMNPVDGYTVHS